VIDFAKELGINMKPSKVNGGVKGANFERVIAKLLGTWSGIEFARVPKSGGLGWKTVDTIGDITPKDRSKKFIFTVECKNYKDFKLPDLQSGKHITTYSKGQLLKFMQQALKDSVLAEKEPLLIAKTSGMRTNDYIAGISLKAVKLLDITPYSMGFVPNDYTGEHTAVAFIYLSSLTSILYSDVVSKLK